MGDLATVSHHLTPQKLQRELDKFDNSECEIYVINLKPMYRDIIIGQIAQLNNDRIKILEVGKVYEW